MTGKITRENPTKLQSDQNVWHIATAPDPSFAEPIQQAQKYSAEDLINEIKEKLKARGTTSIRGLGRVFRIMDNNRSMTLDVEELQTGLADQGVRLEKD